MSEQYENDRYEHDPVGSVPNLRSGENSEEYFKRKAQERQDQYEAHIRTRQSQIEEYERQYGKLNINSEPPPWW